MKRRRFVAGAAAVVALRRGWRAAPRAADVARFALGVASGQPRADGMVLWTRLTGDGLARARAGALGGRRRRGASSASSRAARRPPRRRGRTASTPSRAASRPARWYWYRFRALGEQSAVGRTRTAPAADCGGDAALRDRELPALRRRPLRGLAPRRRPTTSTSCCSSATTSTSTRRGTDPVRRHRRQRASSTLAAVPRPLRDLQERPAAAGGARARRRG